MAVGLVDEDAHLASAVRLDGRHAAELVYVRKEEAGR